VHRRLLSPVRRSSERPVTLQPRLLLHLARRAALLKG